MKHPDCRSCKLSLQLSNDAGFHQLVDVGLFCPVCLTDGKTVLHPETDDLSGDCYECNNCHNYILYVENGIIQKDEVYLSEETFLIRHVVENYSLFVKDGSKAYEVGNIIQFSNVNELFDRLNKLVVFS